MTSRAVLLPTPGDPFLLRFWLNCFKWWHQHVDRIYIGLNTPLTGPVRTYMEDLILDTPKASLIGYTQTTDHGIVVKDLLEVCEEDMIMLVEDDCYIWDGFPIGQAFSLIESGAKDIIGSKRGSCGFEILEAARNKFGISYEGIGDQGPNFWPNLFFSKRKTLLNTDRNFRARMWKAGETIEWLGHTCKEDQAGDTFVNTSLQLRCQFPENRIGYLPQYHGNTTDLEDRERGVGIFDGRAPWIHVGSLSSGVSGILRDPHNRPLSYGVLTVGSDDVAEEAFELPHKPGSEMEKREWERRIAFWSLFHETAVVTSEDLAVFHDLYGRALQRVIRQFALSTKTIRRMMEAYQNLIHI